MDLVGQIFALIAIPSTLILLVQTILVLFGGDGDLDDGIDLNGNGHIDTPGGGGAVYGYHDPIGESKWSEERQCIILREQIEAVLTHPDCSGIFIWQLADVRVDEEWAMKRPRTHNNKGVVNEYRQPKMSYQVVKELFGKL